MTLPRWRTTIAVLVVATTVSACGGASEAASEATRATSTTSVSEPAATDVPAPRPTTTTAPAPTTTAPAETTAPAPDGPSTVAAGLVVESRVADVSAEQLDAVVAATLADPRGWSAAGFDVTVEAEADHRLILAEPDEVDALCAPYRTQGRYSCQLGPLVVLNAERWRQAVAHWDLGVDEYRRMLINHEVGHLLGQHHQPLSCAPGAPAPVMAQQSKDLGTCAPGVWPQPDRKSVV